MYHEILTTATIREQGVGTEIPSTGGGLAVFRPYECHSLWTLGAGVHDGPDATLPNGPTAHISYSRRCVHFPASLK